jgi:hypothetical protein
MSWFTTVYGVIRNETLHVLSAWSEKLL